MEETNMEEDPQCPFFVVEMLDMPEFHHKDYNKFICVPRSWILTYEPSDQQAFIKYSFKDLLETRRRVKYEESYLDHWPAYRAQIKGGRRTYKSANGYITALYNRAEVQQQHREEIEVQENESGTLEKASPRPDFNFLADTDNTVQEMAENNSMESKTSEIQNTPQIKTTSINPNKNKQQIFEPGLSDLLTKLQSYSEELQTTTDQINRSYGENCVLIKDMVNLVDNFNDLYCDNFSDISAANSNDINNNTARYEEAQKTMEMDEDDNDVESEAEIEDEYEIESLIKRSRKFILPENYDKNNSRWTLRYPKYKPGLVELLPRSGVYVNKKRISKCLEESKSASQLARLLLLEIFSVSALSICTITGRRSHYRTEEEVRPGLDIHARTVLLRFVEIHSNNPNWGPFNKSSVLSSIRAQLQQMRILNEAK